MRLRIWSNISDIRVSS